MKTSHKGLNLIKRNEGLRLKAYYCAAKVLTIGYGHTGPDVYVGQVITETQAENLLKKDLTKFETGVLDVLGASAKNLIQEEFDAMVSLAFNIGLAAFGRSSVAKHYKAGRKLSAANSFSMWNKGGGKVLAGLVRRRAEEKALFLSAMGYGEEGQLESATVPDKSNDKSLIKSREIFAGASLGLGGVTNLINDFSIGDFTTIKESIQDFADDIEMPFLKEIYLPEISSILVTIIGLYIIWKRITARKEGIR